MTDNHDLAAFVLETNRIEGIRRAPIREEIAAHRGFLELDAPGVEHIVAFVSTVAGAVLRARRGQDVQVGGHRPPPGGPAIAVELEAVMAAARAGDDPYLVHVRYETLHPFMDGNGRSGRVLWLWQMVRQGRDPYALRRGFLHSWYYQSLAMSRR